MPFVPTPRFQGKPFFRRQFRLGQTVAPSATLVGVAAVFLLIWELRFVILMLFGSILFAVLMSSLAGLVTRVARLPRALALALVCILLVLALVAGGIYLGPILTEQGRLLAATIETAVQRFNLPLQTLDDAASSEAAKSILPSLAGLASRATSLLGGVVETFTGLFLMFALGAYLAFEPNRYISIAEAVLPRGYRSVARRLLHDMGDVIGRWLIGQSVSMLLIGSAVFLGLNALGAPLPFALGLLVGLTAFVPYIGAIISGAVMVLVASTESWSMAAYVLALYFSVQLLEDTLIAPVIQSKAVRLPAAIILLCQIAFGTLFGIAGIILATPLAAAASVPIQRLWGTEEGTSEEPPATKIISPP